MAVVGYVRAAGHEHEDAARQLSLLRGAGAEILLVDRGPYGDPAQWMSVTTPLEAGDTVLVVSLDRLADSLPGLVHAVTELDSRGVRLRSLTAPAIDTRCEGGRSVVAFAAVLRALHRPSSGRDSERAPGEESLTRSGPGRPSVMTPQRVSTANAMRTAGQSLSAIAEALGVSASSVARALSRAGKA